MVAFPVIFSPHFTTLNLAFYKSNYFQVVSEFQQNGLDFILKAINHPTYLEDLTGLTELMNTAKSFRLDWDIEEEPNDDEGFVEISSSTPPFIHRSP